MTSCTGTRAEMFGEDYLRGTLPEVEAQSFEEHFLGCDACFEHLRALQAVRTAFERKPSTFAMRPPAWAAFALAAAAVILVALIFHQPEREHPRQAQSVPLQAPVEQSGGPLKASPQQAPAPEAPRSNRTIELASLADRTLPPFRQTQLRGAAEDEHFEAGMLAYVANNCKTALDELRRIPRKSAHADAAALYAGACHYSRRNFDAARRSLSELAANQDSPLSEAARYYLAQVELMQNRSDSARHWLKEVVALHGDYEARARKQLQKIN